MAIKLTPVTPGDVLLEEFLKPMEITQNQPAKDINVPANRVSYGPSDTGSDQVKEATHRLFLGT